ncbi:poly-gamma-glutamate synthesis protein (capsule biosynthesis protein) [Eubacterium oxidoreducens]|uniref:Poly-gamma-glutamate synthesis protein (Capsule biosynthesis protein) n=2 Tax=Eubacterium oxidoreducens TaxID=1732 RepID=A0A1G6B6G2_EUBOX|nr:poly-gamma-glutamate synthesis protein (capsule biosynthesis protein) [Eubacterium oxidoreducens]
MVVICGLIVCGVSGGAALLSGDTMSAEETKAADRISKQVNARLDKEDVFDGIDLNAQIDLILDHATKKSLKGYPIDDSFLLWVYANYGKSVIVDLAQEFTSGEKITAAVWEEMTGASIHALWSLYCEDTGLYMSSQENVYIKDTNSSNEVVFDFAGDISFTEDAESEVYSATKDYLDANDGDITTCFSKKLLNEMQSADIMMVNAESCFSTRGTAVSGKAYHFRSNPKSANYFLQMGVDIVNLANNHVYDYGKRGFIDTLNTMEKMNLPYVGAGRNLNDASEPVYFVANGKKYAICSATQIERTAKYTKEATSRSPGVLKCLNPTLFVEYIKKAKKNADYVIVYVHWGTEHTSAYGADQQSLAMQFVEAGADVIIGGHTHCLQGIQYIDDVPVIYSLGDFWFSNETKMTGIAQVVFDADGLSEFNFIACEQKNCVTKMVKGEKKAKVISHMNAISTGVTIESDGSVNQN